MGKRNFKSAAAYKKWLGYGHASGEFAKTPGHQKVSIRGKRKKVQHKKRGGKYQAGTPPYALPTNAATTSTMSAVAAPNTLANLETAEREREISRREKKLTERAERLEQEAAARQQFQTALETQGTKVGGQLAPNLFVGAQIGKGTADAAQIAKASKDTGQLLTNLGAYGQGTKAGIGAAVKGVGPGVGGAALSLAGSGVKRLSDDADATTMNFGETTGTLMQGAGTGLTAAGILGGLGATGFGLPLAAIGALGYGIHGLVQRNKARKEEERKEAEETELGLQSNIDYSNLLAQSRELQGADMGFNIGSSMSNSYLPGQQFAQAGGVKLPGGKMVNLPGGAKEFIGNKHSKGGIMLEDNVEVEGGETMDKVMMKEGNNQDYIFSDFLKLGGKSFAQRHKELLKSGGSKREIQNLAKLQEQVAKKEGRDENGPRDPNMIMQEGGPIDGEELVRNILPEVPEQQSQDPTTGLYSREGMSFDLQKTIEANPWYDWSDFDPSNKEDVLDFQKAYNKEIKERGLDEKGWPSIREDSKFGEQTSSVFLGKRDMEPIQPKGVPTNDIPTPELQGSPKEVGDIPQNEIPDELGDITRLPSVVPLLGAAAQWPRSERLKDPKAVKTAPVGKQRLARINMNAERAAGEAGRVAMSRAAENLGGPAAFAAKIAGNQQARTNALNIANQEARQNIQLSGQEAGMDLQRQIQNQKMGLRADMFNRQRQDAVDRENYLQRNIDRARKGEIVADTLNTYQRMAADERLARATDPFGSYERLRDVEAMRLRGMLPGNRFAGMTEGDRRDLAAQMYTNQMSPDQLYAAEQQAYVTNMQEPAQEETTQQKRGGYIKRSNRVRRKRKK